MSFIIVGGSVVSYAEYTDVLQKDQRLLEANEIQNPAQGGFTDVEDFIEDLLTKSTNRINKKIKASAWWLGYLGYTGSTVSNPALIPDFNPDRIVSSQQDFTDMCVYYCLYNYLLPLIGDFSTEESQEVQKIRYYEAKFNDIFDELLAMADWYDADGDGTVDNDEKVFTYAPVRRSRRRSQVVRVR